MLVKIVTVSFSAALEDEQPFSIQQPAAAQRQAARIFHRRCFSIAMPPTFTEISAINCVVSANTAGNDAGIPHDGTGDARFAEGGFRIIKAPAEIAAAPL